jgi:hypothetical protein
VKARVPLKVRVPLTVRFPRTVVRLVTIFPDVRLPLLTVAVFAPRTRVVRDFMLLCSAIAKDVVKANAVKQLTNSLHFVFISLSRVPKIRRYRHLRVSVFLRKNRIVLAITHCAQLCCKSPALKMKSAGFFAGALFTMSIFSSGAAATPEQSVSPSGQFVIYGGEVRFRGAVSNLAERTKTDLLGILRRHDDWKIRIVVRLQSRAANLPEIPTTVLRLSQTGSGPKLQLDLTVRERIDSERIEHELMRAILLEMIYRNHPAIAPGEDYVEAPPWLIDGLLAAMPNRDAEPLKDALRVSHHVRSLDEFLHERPELLDPTGQLLYRAYSFALVQLLIEGNDGRARTGRYIDNLAFASNNPLLELETAFPDFARKEEMWKAKIATIGKRTDLLTFSQSEEQLAALLQTNFPALDSRGKSLSLEKLCETKPNRSQQLALQKLVQDLILLSEHAHQVLRPIVRDYQEVAARVALGKTRAATARLTELKDLRARLSARMTEVDDYMNWFEATQLRTSSGLFDNYLKSAADTEAPSHRRNDALSVYLDAVEQQN